ncbi:hypothetical protein ACU61A_40590 [Pseudonocardia sichuanensis]
MLGETGQCRFVSPTNDGDDVGSISTDVMDVSRLPPQALVEPVRLVPPQPARVAAKGSLSGMGPLRRPVVFGPRIRLGLADDPLRLFSISPTPPQPARIGERYVEADLSRAGEHLFPLVVDELDLDFELSARGQGQNLRLLYLVDVAVIIEASSQLRPRCVRHGIDADVQHRQRAVVLDVRRHQWPLAIARMQSYLEQLRNLQRPA